MEETTELEKLLEYYKPYKEWEREAHRIEHEMWCVRKLRERFNKWAKSPEKIRDAQFAAGGYVIVSEKTPKFIEYDNKQMTLDEFGRVYMRKFKAEHAKAQSECDKAKWQFDLLLKMYAEKFKLSEFAVECKVAKLRDHTVKEIELEDKIAVLKAELNEAEKALNDLKGGKIQ